MADHDSPIYYGERTPSDSIANYVAAFWHWRVDAHVAPFIHTVPLDGCVSLWFSNTVGFGITGPQTQPMKVPARGGDRMYGVRFWPGVAELVLPFNAVDIRNAVRVCATAQIGQWLSPTYDAFTEAPTEVEAAEVWESALAAAFAVPPTLDTAVLEAVVEILGSGGDAKITSIAAKVNLSPRQLRRRFRQATGVNPKELARISRVRRSLSEAILSANSASWADRAAAHGFADQSHMVHEYQHLAGGTPVGLVRYLQTIDHGTMAKLRR